MGAPDRQQLPRVLNINGFPALPLDFQLLRCQPKTGQLLPELHTPGEAPREWIAWE